ncbi:alpha/beta fold hydrolase [Ureaplasma canigenitalium]|uniref:alpha/beta fold hydrolase n=1 Tax=Ureaplasma canigenitalium TaxID=42092 RepID=UPI0004E28224|nr:alpha/beta hydrolase [Ureaplasma canigenitalium]
MEYIEGQYLNYYFIESDSKKNKKGTIVFIHGLSCTPHYFFLMKNDFTEYDCYFFGLPGHGLTPELPPKFMNTLSFKEIVINQIKNLGLKDVILIGHSLGAALCALVAHPLKDIVKKCVLVCPYTYGFDPNHKNFYWLLPFNVKKHPDRALQQIYYDYRKNYVTLPDTRIDQITREKLQKGLRSVWHIVANLIFSIKLRKELKDAYHHLSIPSLLILSKEDRLINCQTTRKKIKANNQLIVYTFYKSGHIPFIEEVDLFVKVVKDFIDGRNIDDGEYNE